MATSASTCVSRIRSSAQALLMFGLTPASMTHQLAGCRLLGGAGAAVDSAMIVRDWAQATASFSTRQSQGYIGHMGRGQAAVATDQFEAIFGTRRGASRPKRCDAVFAAYSALTQNDLEDCSKFALLPKERAIIAGAKIDREVLDQMPIPSLSIMVNHAETRATIAIEPPDVRLDLRDFWASLAGRLRDCVSAREEREAELRAAANARKMGMLTVEGDIAWSQLIDSLPGLSVRDATNTIMRGVRRLKATYPGATHPEVREAVHAELLRLGIRLEPVSIW